MKLTGIHVPLVTPFLDGKIDFASHDRLVKHLLEYENLGGIMMFGTTGEFLALSETEIHQLIERTIPLINKRVPYYVSVAGGSTQAVVKAIEGVEQYPIDGYLVGSPYYMKPSQAGVIQHYKLAASATKRNVLLYNIPFRSAINIDNNTAFELSKISNVTGIKDVCGNLDQSFDLLARRPDNFTVLAGQDPHFFSTLAYGADGGIIAGAHFATEKFIAIDRIMRAGDLNRGRALWKELQPLVNALFQEPSPIGIKYALAKLKIITSAESRLPMTPITHPNAVFIDQALTSTSNSTMTPSYA
jgi:4-hydroxy-tetrahydrodipicolinate synthase